MLWNVFFLGGGGWSRKLEIMVILQGFSSSNLTERHWSSHGGGWVTGPVFVVGPIVRFAQNCWDFLLGRRGVSSMIEENMRKLKVIETVLFARQAMPPLPYSESWLRHCWKMVIFGCFSLVYHHRLRAGVYWNRCYRIPSLILPSILVPRESWLIAWGSTLINTCISEIWPMLSKVSASCWQINDRRWIWWNI